MSARILGLDLDGTLADHTEAKRAISRELGYELSPAQTASEVLKNLMPDEHYRALQLRLYTDFAHHSPRAEAVGEALAFLQERGWEFVVISRRGVPTHDLARQWIAKELPGFIPEANIFFVEGDAAKDAIAQREGVYAYVDDQHEVLQCLASVRQRFLFDPFKNFAGKMPRDITLLHSWRTLPELLAVFE